MRQKWAKRLSAEPRRSIVYVSLVTVLRIIVQVGLYRRGFVSVSADEFARGMEAARWAIQPRFDVWADMQRTWLPLEKYLNGSLLRVWPDVILVPRVTVFAASCLVFVSFFVLVYYLFSNFPVAALASLSVVSLPWYTWLSGTPMLEMYYLAPFLSGLVLLVMWLKDARRGYWFWAGCCLMLASGFHVQCWVLINVVTLFTVGRLYQYGRQGQSGRLWRLVGFYTLSNAVIVAIVILEFASTGHLFAFLANHTDYSAWFYGGYNASIWDKLLYYPKLVIHNSSGAGWVLLPVALVFLWRDADRQWKRLPLVAAALALSAFSVVNVFSVPATAAPGRYSLFYVMMLSPYVAYGAYRLLEWGQLQPRRVAARASSVVSAGLLLYSVSWGVSHTADFPRGVSPDAVETGRHLNEILSRSRRNGSSYMVELTYWDFLAVQLTAGHYDRGVLDREYDIRNRSTPSIFEEDTAGICTNLSSQNVQLVALHDPHLKAKAQVAGCLRSKQIIGDWTIYSLGLEP